MNKTSSRSEWVKRGGFLLAALSIALTGCQGVLLTYKGVKVFDDCLIALADGNQRSGSYQSHDLTIAYQWERSGNELKLSGWVKFAPWIQNSFNVIQHFDLSLFFTDAEGNILEQRWIAALGSRNPESQKRFNEKLLLPPGTVNMAFSYDGQALDSDPEGSEVASFWQVPVVR